MSMLTGGLASWALGVQVQRAQDEAVPTFPYPAQVPNPWGRGPTHTTVTGPIPPSVRALLDLEHLPHLMARVMRRALAADLTQAEAAAIAPRLWVRCAPRPATAAPASEWLALWRLARYSDNGVVTERPTSPVLLHRGAVAAHARGWCWTPSRSYARLVAAQSGAGNLWSAEVSPDALLGRFPGGEPDPMPIGAQILARECGRTTGLDAVDEFVVDPAMLGTLRPWTAEERATTPVPTSAPTVRSVMLGRGRGHGVW